jgi:hypothetical protein
VPDEYLKGSTKALEGVDYEEFEQNVRSMCDRMVRISIRPQWARFFDFSAGRLPLESSRSAAMLAPDPSL